MPSERKLIKCIVSALDENRRRKRRRRRHRSRKSRSRSRSPRRPSSRSTSPEPKTRTPSPNHRLDVDPEPSPNPSPDIIFNHILTKGLTKEEREIINKKHTMPDNCTLLDAPLLNPEVKVVLTESSKLRDQGIEMSQRQIGLATAIIGKATTDLILTENIDKHKLLSDMADATKILANVHYHQTQTRIKLISPLLDKNFKQIISKTKRDTFLYGENLPELLSSVKKMQQAAAQIKKPNPVVTSNNRPSMNTQQQPGRGNRNGPPPKRKRTARGGPPKATQSDQRRPRWHHSERARARYRNAPTKR